MIVDPETIDDVDEQLSNYPEVDETTHRDAIHLIRTRSKEYADDPVMGDVTPQFIVDHALEDAGVPREERIAIRDDTFPDK